MENNQIPVFKFDYYDYEEILQSDYTKKDTQHICEMLLPPKMLRKRMGRLKTITYPIYQDDDGAYHIGISDIYVPAEEIKKMVQKFGHKIMKVCCNETVLAGKLLLTLSAFSNMRDIPEFIYDGPPDDPTLSRVGQIIGTLITNSPLFEVIDRRYDPETGAVKAHVKIDTEESNKLTNIVDFDIVNLKHLDTRTEIE